MPGVTLGWFHRYPARFAPRIVARMIDTSLRRLGRRRALILDPFAGTGATLAASRQLRCESVGLELSELGVLISQVRLSPPHSLDDLLEYVADVTRFRYRTWCWPVKG